MATGLGSQGCQRGGADMRKGELSKFIEEAVRWRVLDRAVEEVKARNAGVPSEEVEAAVDQALEEVRTERFKSSSSDR